MDVGLVGCIVIIVEFKEKIYWFINKYFYSDVIEIIEELVENFVGESYSVVNNIF